MRHDDVEELHENRKEQHTVQGKHDHVIHFRVREGGPQYDAKHYDPPNRCLESHRGAYPQLDFAKEQQADLCHEGAVERFFALCNQGRSGPVSVLLVCALSVHCLGVKPSCSSVVIVCRIDEESHEKVSRVGVIWASPCPRAGSACPDRFKVSNGLITGSKVDNLAVDEQAELVE